MKRSVERTGFVNIAFTSLEEACNFVTGELHHLRRNGFPEVVRIVIVPGGGGENPAASVAVQMVKAKDVGEEWRMPE